MMLAIETNDALLGVLSVLVAGMIWMVKAMTTRSDKIIEQRDKEVCKLIKTLEAAVSAFKNFELEGSEVFHKLIDRLDASEQIQERILRELQAMTVRIGVARDAT